MIYKIAINIITAINVFLYGMDNQHYFNKVSYPIVITLICISLSLDILYNVKYKEEKILLLNILYILLVSYIYPPSFILAMYMIIEYIEVRNYNKLNIMLVIFMYIFISLKMNLDYTNILLGVVSCISIYEIINHQQKVDKLEKYNFDLKEENFVLEERRKNDNKINCQSVESIKIEERNLISQKLHDKIGHTLAGSIMQLEALKIINQCDYKKGNVMLDNIIDNLRDGMDDIRNTLRRIKPEQGQININNLKLMLDKFTNKCNIDTNLKVEGDLNEINLVYWRAIIECINEVLTNSMKYSNGELINVEISVLNKIIRLYIKDNGCYQGDIKKGMGLLGIEERIVNLGGDVYFNNEDGFSNLIILKR
ncbi:hypothetical protein EAI30_04650 [Romboutsia ilealis]|uniref:histidine kinase n=1 Tax=Romboutsia faecis TaxID=2764597 RepID=A0ABR7JLK2_9FIRM|nr:histidine kinase [Romboutsia faecis]MBC5995705.1 hypothetical protein [Romboutsia faecis]MRN23906.1 hypothetical protein [Romboutsia ilealis]